MHYNDKVVKVFETGIEYITDWGYTYTLYANNSFYEENLTTYYTNEGDGTDTLSLIGSFSSFEDAKQAFNEYMIGLKECD